MAEVARVHDVVFVDLFHTIRGLYAQSDRRLTINGIHLNEHGNEVVAQLMARRRYNEGFDALTAREREVLALMAEGRSNKAIADQLVIGEGAVEKHISNIFSKLGLASTEADHRRVLAVLTFLRG